MYKLKIMSGSNTPSSYYTNGLNSQVDEFNSTVNSPNHDLNYNVNHDVNHDINQSLNNSLNYNVNYNLNHNLNYNNMNINNENKNGMVWMNGYSKNLDQKCYEKFLSLDKYGNYVKSLICLSDNLKLNSLNNYTNQKNEM